MTAGWHPFVDSGRRELGASGRSYALCATCGRKRIGLAHGRVDRRAPTMNPRVRDRLERSRLGPPKPKVTPTPTPPPTAPAAPPVRVADWRLSMLRVALDQALEGPRLELATRLRLEDARRALRSELAGTVATAELVALRPSAIAAPAEPVPAREPSPAPANPPADVHSSEARRVAHSFRAGKMRSLFLRAVDAGWRWSIDGNSHVRLLGPAGAVLTLSTTANDRGRGWMNQRASAKRYGLNVDGL